MFTPNSTPIKLVTTAEKPEVKLVFKDLRDETVVDFSLYGSIACHLLVRKRTRKGGAPGFRVDGTLTSDGSDGSWSFDFTNYLKTTTIAEGDYEAEVNFLENGSSTRKLYHLINIKIREGMIEQ